MMPQMVWSGLAPLTMNYLFIMEDFELTVEAIVDATDGGDNVGATNNELVELAYVVHGFWSRESQDLKVQPTHLKTHREG
jgi:hypothetical protein